MENKAYDEEDGIVVTSFSKKDVTQQPIRTQADEVVMMAPPYSEVSLGAGEEFVEIKLDDQKATKFDSATISISTTIAPSPFPYPNMSKEDVLRFSNTPFWTNLRVIALLIFWLMWLAFLAAVIALTITTPRCGPAPSKQWFHKSVFYDVYVRSFYDSDNDGVGDIKGIQEKLPTLKEMGVDVVVLSSILQSRDANSPSADLYNGKFDYGYEVTDYKAIDSSLGSVTHFDDLINATHDLGMKLVMDYVPNHSSIDHAWFTSFEEADDFEEGWNNYVSGKKDLNNWKNFYNNSLSAWVETGSQGAKLKHYYSQFLEKTQPELNLRSDFIKKQLEDGLKHWLEMGVDGFRIVHSDYLIESSDLASNPANDFSSTRHHNDSIDLLNRWRHLIANFDHESKRLLITDGDSNHHEFQYRYYSRGCEVESHLPINHALLDVSKGKTKPRDVVEKLKTFFSSIPEGSIALWTTGGQDDQRLESRSGVNMTRPLTLLKMTLPGSASLYYGEEIEMVDDVQVENLKKDPVWELVEKTSRFGSRQPMYWTNATNAGFSPTPTTNPWLTLNKNVDIVTENVEYQKSEKASVWSLLKELSEFRRTRPSLQHGNIHFGFHDDHLLTYLREYPGDDRLLIVINMSDSKSTVADVTKNYTFPIETSSVSVALTTNSNEGPYQKNGEVNLRAVASLPPGYGFVAKWKYVRSL